MKVLAIVIGVLLAIGGVWMIFSPGATFLSIGWLIGILLTARGVSDIATCIANRKAKSPTVWQILGGVLSIVVGLVVLTNGFAKFLTEAAILYTFGFYMIASGVIGAATAIMQRKANGGWHTTALVVMGVLSVLAGIFFVGRPLFAAIAAGLMIGFSVLMRGCELITIGMMSD